MAYIVVAYVAMAYVVMAYVFMAYVVMAYCCRARFWVIEAPCTDAFAKKSCNLFNNHNLTNEENEDLLKV